MSALRVLHVSDVHVPVPVGAIPAADWLSKRAIGGLNYLLRRGPRFAEAEAKLAELGRFAADEAVDLVVASGDFTVLGTEPEHARARQAIRPLAGRPEGLFAVPGNHDVYLDDAVRAERFRRHFGDLVLAADLPSLAVDGPYPLVRRIGEHVALLAVDSTRPNPQPWRSSGRIPEAQLEGLRRALAEPALRDRFKVVVTHYAPRLWDGRPDRRSHGLENADALLEVLAPHTRTCLLHGHVHRRYAVKVPGVGPTLLCAGSSTERGHEGAWLLELGAGPCRALAVERGPSGYRQSGEIVALG